MSIEVFKIMVGSELHELENPNGLEDQMLYERDPQGNLAGHLQYATSEWFGDERDEVFFDGYMRAVLERGFVDRGVIARWASGIKEYPHMSNQERMQRLFKIVEDTGIDI